MTKEELAAQLNGREYRHEISDHEEKDAKANDLVVIFGASDDLCELRGAINDELGAYREALILIKDGKLLQEIDDDDIDTLKKYDALGLVIKLHQEATKIHACWCTEPGYSWTYRTTAPHATFEVVEGEEKYCRGIIIDLKELAAVEPGRPRK